MKKIFFTKSLSLSFKQWGWLRTHSYKVIVGGGRRVFPRELGDLNLQPSTHKLLFLTIRLPPPTFPLITFELQNNFWCLSVPVCCVSGCRDGFASGRSCCIPINRKRSVNVCLRKSWLHTCVTQRNMQRRYSQ